MYIAFYKGRSRLFNKFVAWWTQGPYSHVEAIFNVYDKKQHSWLCASSSFMDKGVRFKQIELNPAHWDVLEVPFFNEAKVYQWFLNHARDAYDVLGLFSTSIPLRHGQRKYFCNEALGTAAGLKESWRYTPNSFARLCELLPGSRWISFMELERRATCQTSPVQGVELANN